MWKISTRKSVVIAYGGDHATNLSTPIDNDQKKKVIIWGFVG